MRAALYLRISQDRDGLELGIDRQRKECLARLGSGAVVTEYVDNSVSATSKKVRPAYTRLLADVRAGLYDLVVVWDLDRLTRKPREMEDWVDLGEAGTVTLVTVSDNIDLASDNGRMFVRIKAAVARAEMDRKAARQIAANLQRAEAGQPITGRRPFGFEHDRMTVRESEAAHIRALYADFLDGASMHSLARRLNDAGVRTSRDGAWTTINLRHVLRRPANAGLMYRHGERMPVSKIEPIVSETDWAAACALLNSRSVPAGPKVETGLLTGLMYCVCGESMARKTVTGHKGRTAHYLCKTKAYKNATNNGKHVTIAAHIAEREVTRRIVSMYLDGALDTPAREDEGLRTVTGKLAENARAREAATDAFMEPGVDKVRVRRRLAELASEAEALTLERDRKLAQSADSGALRAFREALEKGSWVEQVAAIGPGLEAWASMPMEDKRTMIRGSIRVSVSAEGRGAERVQIAALS